jgi:hypothetical protein
MIRPPENAMPRDKMFVFSEPFAGRKAEFDDLHNFACNSFPNLIGRCPAYTVQVEQRVDSASCRVPTPTVALKKASLCLSSGNGSGMVRPF